MRNRSGKTIMTRWLAMLLAAAVAAIALAAGRAPAVSASGDVDTDGNDIALTIVSIPDNIIDEIDADSKLNNSVPLGKTLTAADVAGLAYKLENTDVVLEADDVADVANAVKLYDDDGMYYALDILLSNAGAAQNAAAKNANSIHLQCWYNNKSAYAFDADMTLATKNEDTTVYEAYSENKTLPKKGVTLKEFGDYTVAVNNTDKTASIVQYNEPATNTPASVVIPSGNASDVSGDAQPGEDVFTITNIEANAFRDAGMSSVTMPETLKSIGYGAFFDCEHLDEVALNDGLEDIGAEAFHNTALESADIPASVKEIGDEAFSSCEKLTTVNYQGDEKPDFGESVFWNTPYALDTKVVSLPKNVLNEETRSGDSVGNISSARFAGGKLNLTPWDKDAYEVTIPDNCTVKMTAAPASGDTDKKYTYQVAFKDSDNNDYLMDFTLKQSGDDVVCETVYHNTTDSWLNAYAPSTDEAETADQTYPILSRTSVLPADGSTVENDDAFTYDVTDKEAKIKKYIGDGGEVVIPAKYNGKPVTAVLENAFKDCESVTSVNFADPDKSNCAAVYPNAFSGCKNLGSVELPDSIRYIGEGAFKDCGLDEIAVPPYVSTIGADTSKKIYAFDDEITVKGAEGSAAEAYCKDNTDPKYKFEKTGEPVIAVPVSCPGSFMDGDVTVTVTKPGATSAAFTLTTPHTVADTKDKNGGCTLYIDSSKLDKDTEYDIDVTRDGYTSYTVTKFKKDDKSIPSDIELYPGDFNKDGSVDLADVAELSKAYGTKGESKIDLNEDEVVDIKDVSLLISGYTKTSKKSEAPAASNN